MTTVVEFPGNCVTNTYILHDFGEVAYIVCSVATPPAAAQNAPLPSLENNISRLRNTEKQFRQAAILAAIDIEKLQLFTFYKKVDVLRDKKSLLTKFGFVLRSNACTIAYKAATRVPDLLKQENLRLYRLFVAAVLASVKVSPLDDRLIQPIGTRSYLIENPLSALDFQFRAPRVWYLHRTDLQVIPTGQVILTVAVENSLSLIQLSDVPIESIEQTQERIPVVLAPIGQVAIYRGGWIGPEPSASKPLPSQHTIETWRIWHTNISQWLGNEFQITLNDEEIWIELCLPFLDAEVSPIDETDIDESTNLKKISWRHIFWPARFAFTEDTILELQSQKSAPTSDDDDDPVAFAQDWVKSAAERQEEATKVKKEHVKGLEEEEDPLFADDGPFDNPDHFQPFGPPAFPASQTIYPTPPDVVMAHTTPGMSSVDGFVMTPANVPKRGSEIQHVPLENESSAFDTVQASAVGSGFYDEDLFEEMPGDNFGTEGAGDEPNWDFFDAPDMDVDNDEELKADGSEFKSLVEPKVPDSASLHHVTKAVSYDDTENLSYVEQAPDMPLVESDETKLGAVEGHNGTTEASSISSTHLAQESKPHPQINAAEATEFDDHRRENTPGTRSPFYMPRGKRRRSSIYEGIYRLGIDGKYDNRYSAEGEYFFDTKLTSPVVQRNTDLAHWIKKSPSTSSESDVSSVDGETLWEVLSPNGKHRKEWTEYTDESAVSNVPENDRDNASLEQSIRALLESLQAKSISFPSLEAFHLFKEIQREVDLEIKNILQVVQILVDQISQSTLLQTQTDEHTRMNQRRKHNEISVDLTNINTSINYATLTQLTGIKPTIANVNAFGKTARLRSWQIETKRAEQKLVSSISILPYWEILGLQPNPEPKNATVFCLSPSGSSYTEGCTNFLQRITDSYGSCNLGSQTIGRLAGVANEGLITWNMDKSSMPNQLQAAKRFGAALANSSEIKGDIIIYMISTKEEWRSYLECCSTFCTLSQSFLEARPHTRDEVELIPQIIPVDFVASVEAPVTPSQQEYFRLAVEVFNRLPSSHSRGVPAAWDYAIGLSNPDHTIHFNLDAIAASPFAKDGPSLHVSYSITEDRHWLVAAWTDEIGKLGWTMTYPIDGLSSAPGRQREEVLKDIWEVSHDIMRKHHGPWRLTVARNGAFEIAESNEWIHIANHVSLEASNTCTLYLVAIELDPTLKVLPSASAVKQGSSAPSFQPNIYGTPASTPQAVTTSPEQHVAATPTPGGTSAMNAPTPPDQTFDPNNESDLLLTDPVEETWAVILPYGVNQSPKIHDIHPALASGYLLKRLGPKDEDGVSMIGVHLTHAPPMSPNAPQGRQEEILEEIINQYRGLVTLAATRGCIDPMQECVPWHIITALKGSRVLDQVL